MEKVDCFIIMQNAFKLVNYLLAFREIKSWLLTDKNFLSPDQRICEMKGVAGDMFSFLYNFRARLSAWGFYSTGSHDFLIGVLTSISLFAMTSITCEISVVSIVSFGMV